MLSYGSEVAEAQAVILATGVARGKKLPGEAEFLGRGVSYCATCDGMLYRGRAVVVTGNAADVAEESAFLREIGCNVTFVGEKRRTAFRRKSGLFRQRNLRLSEMPSLPAYARMMILSPAKESSS
jgi:thioredoxin reductase (NADPH)